MPTDQTTPTPTPATNPTIAPPETKLAPPHKGRAAAALSGTVETLIDFFPWRRMSKMPVVIQTEASECGLACLAMIMSYFGRPTRMEEVRQALGSVSNGMTMRQIIDFSGRAGLTCRPVKAELTSLKYLRTPCILHWEMDHFVVLKRATDTTVVIHDPQVGLRQLSLHEVSSSFTGVAMEFEPNPGFDKKSSTPIPTIRSMMGRTDGLVTILLQIAMLALLLEIVGLLSPAAMQWLVDKGLSSADQSQIVALVAGMGLLSLFNLVVGTLRGWMVTYLTVSFGFQWAVRVMNHIMHLPVAFFEQRSVGDIMSRAGSAASIQQTITTGVVEGILDGLLGLGTLVMIFLYSPLLALTAIAAIVALIVLQLLVFPLSKALGNESLVAEARVSTNFIETLRGIRAIVLANRVDHRRAVWQNLSVEAINIKIRGMWLGLASSTLGTLITATQKIVAIYLAATLISKGQFTVGMLFAYLAYQDQFAARVGGLVSLFFQFRMLKLHLERLSDIVLTPTEHASRQAMLMGTGAGADSGLNPSQEGQPSFAPPASSLSGAGGAQELASWAMQAQDVVFERGDVQFKNVTFKYAQYSPLVLEALSFTTAGSGCTVIVGRTGAGKSTLAKLILGIYRPTSGQILLDDQPLDQIALSALRDNIASVLQGDTLLSGSIRDNITFFSEAVDHDWMQECARIACIHEDIERMPMRYHSLVGDLGSTLSAGQQQRLLIARALYRRPKILLLDEGTSALDVATEIQINQNLAQLNLRRFYIAHRPDTIKLADQVIRLGD